MTESLDKKRSEAWNKLVSNKPSVIFLTVLATEILPQFLFFFSSLLPCTLGVSIKILEKNNKKLEGIFYVDTDSIYRITHYEVQISNTV